MLPSAVKNAEICTPVRLNSHCTEERPNTNCDTVKGDRRQEILCGIKFECEPTRLGCQDRLPRSAQTGRVTGNYVAVFAVVCCVYIFGVLQNKFYKTTFTESTLLVSSQSRWDSQKVYILATGEEFRHQR